MGKRKWKKMRNLLKEHIRDLDTTVFPISSKNSEDLKTVERVMNKSTALVIQKCINHGDINEFVGCISSGKEACVFYCPSDKYGPCAMKIHQTTGMSVFKDRDKYINNHRKFRRGCLKHSASHQIRLWALQEFINIHKLLRAGVSVPRPLLVRSHMFLMEFLGENEVAAPLLKNVVINVSHARKMYRALVLDMYTMYRVCKLVHGDLSDYNMLVHKNKLYIIDMSQSVGPDHPFSNEFLARDCFNVTECFRKRGVATLTVKELFFFIVDDSISDANKDACFKKFMQRAEERGVLPPSRKEERSQEVFHGLPYVPQSFSEMTNFLKLEHQETLMDQRQLHELDCEALFEVTTGRDISSPVAPNFPFEDDHLSSITEDNHSPVREGSSQKKTRINSKSTIITVEGGYSIFYPENENSNILETKANISRDINSQVIDLSKKTSGEFIPRYPEPHKRKERKESEFVLQHPDRIKWETTQERKSRKAAIKCEQAARRRAKVKSGKRKKRGPKNRRKCGVKKRT